MKDVFPEKRIVRKTNDAVISGVCSGVAQYFGIDAVWVRTAAVLAVFMMPMVAIAAYALAVFLLPRG